MHSLRGPVLLPFFLNFINFSQFLIIFFLKFFYVQNFEIFSGIGNNFCDFFSGGPNYSIRILVFVSVCIKREQRTRLLLPWAPFPLSWLWFWSTNLHEGHFQKKFSNIFCSVTPDPSYSRLSVVPQIPRSALSFFVSGPKIFPKFSIIRILENSTEYRKMAKSFNCRFVYGKSNSLFFQYQIKRTTECQRLRV